VISFIKNTANRSRHTPIVSMSQLHSLGGYHIHIIIIIIIIIALITAN